MTIPSRRPVISLWSDITCGEACWHAREDICRCSCGGKNHGCLRGEGGATPVRTAKIAGERYELAAVGWYKDLHAEARALNERNGFRSIDAGIPDHRYHYTWRETDDWAPARLRPASVDQVEKWPELAAYRQADRYLLRIEKPSLLWRRVEMPECYFCPDQCDRCDRQRAAYPAPIASPEPAPKLSPAQLLAAI